MDDSMLLKSYILDWLETFKQNSIKSASYDRLITSLVALEHFPIARMPIRDISLFDIQRYINELVERGYALTTIKKQVHLVTAPLKQAAAMRILPADPSCGIILPSQHKVKKKPRQAIAYTPEEQGKLWQVIHMSYKSGYLCVGVMLETGLRAGEALALDWSCVDIPHRRLKVTATVVNLANKKQSFIQDSPKSIASIRTIPLTEVCVEILLKLRETPGPWVFSSHDSHLSYEALRYQTMSLCREAGVPYYGEHIFRHTFATNCYYRGVDVKILSRILGHCETSVTYNTYVNLYGDAFDEMYAALNG